MAGARRSLGGRRFDDSRPRRVVGAAGAEADERDAAEDAAVADDADAGAGRRKGQDEKAFLTGS